MPRLSTHESAEEIAHRQRLDEERRTLEELIHARTVELNRVNPIWDQKVTMVLSADVRPEVLDQLAREAPEEDYYLLRLISEHPKVPEPRPGRRAELGGADECLRGSSAVGERHAFPAGVGVGPNP